MVLTIKAKSNYKQFFQTNITNPTVHRKTNYATMKIAMAKKSQNFGQKMIAVVKGTRNEQVRSYLNGICIPSRSDLWYFATRQTPTSAARVMQCNTQLLFEHPNLDQRGQLWLGHWTPLLCQDLLLPLPQPLPLREGQAALARIGRRATEVFCDLWDLYGVAIALAQPSPKEPDFNLDTHHHMCAPPTPLSPASPLLPPPSPLPARLAADNG